MLRAACGERKLGQACNAHGALECTSHSHFLVHLAARSAHLTECATRACCQCSLSSLTSPTDQSALGPGLEAPARRVTAVPLHVAHATPHSLARAQLPGRALPRSQVGPLLHAWCTHWLVSTAQLCQPTWLIFACSVMTGACTPAAGWAGLRRPQHGSRNCHAGADARPGRLHPGTWRRQHHPDPPGALNRYRQTHVPCLQAFSDALSDMPRAGAVAVHVLQ